MNPMPLATCAATREGSSKKEDKKDEVRSCAQADDNSSSGR
jgi:hypothetical protein